MVLLAVHVNPKSAGSALIGWEEAANGTRELLVRLAAPPQDGKANEALVKLLSHQLGIPKSAITIKRGQSSRHKLLAIALEQQELEARLHV
jgi:uncharacterized protein (TIGR00251 family)